jgi:hypothetical protein
MLSPLRLYSGLFVAAAGLSTAAYYVMRARRKTPEQRERERRLRIAEIGRITDGTIVDVCELAAPLDLDGKKQDTTARAAQLLIFHYDVAGVTYETSQDVTALRHYIDLHQCKLGVPASIKYDPQNPGNSIVIAEAWSGLRK